MDVSRRQIVCLDVRSFMNTVQFIRMKQTEPEKFTHNMYTERRMLDGDASITMMTFCAGGEGDTAGKQAMITEDDERSLLSVECIHPDSALREQKKKN